ncbi:MAG: hypothetical protein R3E82_20845 [Pseudomonadales bacterium]
MGHSSDRLLRDSRVSAQLPDISPSVKNQLALLIALLFISGCAARTDVISTDFTRQSGLYVVAFVDSPEVRAQLEDQFVRDLADQNIRGVASRTDIPDIKRARPSDMVRAANRHDVAAVVIINRVARDGTGGIIESDRRITPDNPDLHAYYEATKDELDLYQQNEPVFAEVNAFFVDGNRTRRFWTGTTWAFNEGDATAVIGGISKTIAAEMARVRDEIRSYDRPMR